MSNATRRLAALEKRHGTAPRIDRIITTAPGGSPDAVVMERQADGRWKHYPLPEGAQHG